VVGTDSLDSFVTGGSAISGAVLSKAAKDAQQVIWGEFAAKLENEGSNWVTIRAIDSSFYEVTSSDSAVIETVRSAYSDIKITNGPVQCCPIEPIHE